MSFLKTIYNVEDKTWNIDVSEAGANWNEVQLQFSTLNDEYQDVSNLKFGVILKHNEEEILSSHHPIFPIEYDKIKTSLIYAAQKELVPNTEYVLEAYTKDKHSDETIDSKSVKFKTPLLPKRFNSWVWNDTIKSWEAPVPHPDPVNGVDDPIPHKLYQWSEKQLKWIEGLPEEVQE